MSSRLVPLILVVVILSGCLGLPSDDNDGSSITGTAINTATPDDAIHQTTSRNVDSTTYTDASTYTDSSTSQYTDASTYTDSSTSQYTDASTPTARSTPAVDPDNPYRKETLTVAIRDKKGGTRDLSPQIQEALDYWEQTAEQYTGYPIKFRLAPNAENPDILISYVSKIESCGNINYPPKQLAGCTRVDGAGSVLVQLETNYSDKSMVDLTIHEFGHVLGLGHDDAPQEYMSAQLNLVRPPSPDITERDLPWNHSTLTVGIDLSGVPSDERAAVKSQINEALAYYDDGAGGTVPESVSFRLGADPETADITIRVSSDSSLCPDLDYESGWCPESYAYNLDGDNEYEIYGHFDIRIYNIPTEDLEKYVGYQLGYAFGFSEPSDWPEQYRVRTSAEARRSVENSSPSSPSQSPVSSSAPLRPASFVARASTNSTSLPPAVAVESVRGWR